jgi:mannose-6-phosphate isomerase-like protein (cupin superfamily)
MAPDGSEIRLLATRLQGARRASLCEVRLAPGGRSQPIFHRTVEEIWYVLEGRGQVWRCPAGAQADPVDVRRGDVLVIPTGWRFQFSAGPRAPLRFLCFTTPAWPGPEEARRAPTAVLGPPTV